MTTTLENPTPRHLALLAQTSARFAQSRDIQDVIREALELVTAYIDAEGGALFLLEPTGQRVVCRACVGPVDIVGVEVALGDGVVGHCVADNRAQIVADVRSSPNFDGAVDDKSGFMTRSILCAPMTINDQRVGAIELVNKRSAQGLFSEADLLMLQTLASSVALAISNARMAAELVAQERVKRELELAAEIQRSLLPRQFLTEFPVYGVNRAAHVVSGDFYDFYPVGINQIYFCIGDVAGKGMNAALLMSKTASLFRCLGKSILNPVRLVSVINDELLDTATHGVFVTMIVGLFDPIQNTVRLVNAGHEPALLRHLDGRIEHFGAVMPPLGILPSYEAKPSEVSVSLTDATLYMCTDGVTEAVMHNGQRLGATGLLQMLDTLSSVPIASRLDALLSQLSANALKLHDDLTLLAIAHTA